MTPEEKERLVEAVVKKVREQMGKQAPDLEDVHRKVQVEMVPALPAVTGTWSDHTALKAWLRDGVERWGTDGSPVDKAPGDLAPYIDHTLLKPDATRAELVRLCEEARKHGFASVCINSFWLPVAVKLLEGSRVMPICVVGFPLGAMVTSAKAAETRDAIRLGAREIDMVINIGALKSGDHDTVLKDIRAVVEAAQGRPVKVILETSMLTREQKIAACALSKAAGAHFVKTSTGFGGGGATVEDIRLMRSIVGPDMGVKASGGVRTADDARNMIAAGADRLGASASVAIVTGGTGKGSY